jgi:hypothetical protein
MPRYDELAKAKADKEWESWYLQAFAARQAIGDFVAQHRPGRPTKTEVYTGSSNFCVHVLFNDQEPDAIIRFPRPGHSAFRHEQVLNEVGAIKYPQRSTNIPIPRLIHWGRGVESPKRLGPFIISEFVPGIRLSDLLKDPTEHKDYLDPKIDDRLLDSIYDQLADFILQIFRPNFDRIGAINSTYSEETEIGRPITRSMNDLATVTGCHIEQFSHQSFERVADFLDSLSRDHMTHLWSQRNIAYSQDQATDL